MRTRTARFGAGLAVMVCGVLVVALLDKHFFLLEGGFSTGWLAWYAYQASPFALVGIATAIGFVPWEGVGLGFLAAALSTGALYYWLANDPSSTAAFALIVTPLFALVPTGCALAFTADLADK